MGTLLNRGQPRSDPDQNQAEAPAGVDATVRFRLLAEPR